MRNRTSLFVVLSFSCLLSMTLSSAQPPPDAATSARLLDAHLQDWAFKALLSPRTRTGDLYDGHVPTNLTGIRVSAMRLRSGSLRTRGVHTLKEFEIPIGVVEQPYVERLVLVYQNLGNWSDKFYPLPGFSYLTPVLGLLAYNAANLSASGLPELDIRASGNPILIKFHDVKSAPFGSLAKCVYFDLNGSVQFGTLLPENVCSTVQQGHFSIVVESNAPSPAPSGVVEVHGGGKNKTKWRIVVPSLIGGIVLLFILGLLIAKVIRAKKRTRIQQLELTAESNETLQMTSIGGTKAPQAAGTRTRPMIENDYVP